MMLILRWIVGAVLILIAASVVPGFEVTGLYAALIAALVLGLINAIIRPLVVILTLPVNIMTLGLFTLVINGVMVWLMATMVKGIELGGFLPAVLVALVLWIGNVIMGKLIKEAKET